MNRQTRKINHINEAITQVRPEVNSFDDVEIIHQSLNALDWDKTSLQVQVGELILSSPLFINAMTGGGGEKTEFINQQLAIAAKETKIAIAVGSQMAALKDESERKTYQIIRKENPTGIVFANVGSEATLEEAKRAVDMIEANALQIHLNVLQELIMPEGDRNFSNQVTRLEEIASKINVPIIVKEVGFGISQETTKILRDIGIKYIDVAGFGGTNFSMIENNRRQKAVLPFNHWGIPTVPSILEVKKYLPNGYIFASGGIRNGIDGVKALILGASLFGMAGRLLKILLDDNVETLIDEIESIHDQVKIAQTTLGAKKPSELKDLPHIFYGRTREWIEQRIK